MPRGASARALPAARGPAAGQAPDQEFVAIVEATYRVITQTDSFDPGVREILREAKVSAPAFYRHFRSKDELYAVLFEDRRLMLTDYLARQMAKHATPAGQVGAWVHGILAQAVDPTIAARTRPFVANLHRMMERFPTISADSMRDIVAVVLPAVAALQDRPTADVTTDATLAYHFAVGVMHHHVREQTAPTEDELEAAVAFVLRGLTDPLPRAKSAPAPAPLARRRRAGARG